MQYHCAYNLPAVLMAAGAERWSELADAHAALAADVQWKVRRSLAFSLHELAALIRDASGERAVDAALLVTFDLFLKDLDEVRVGVLTHLAAFLDCVSDAARRECVGVLLEVQGDADNWRARMLLARQLVALGQAYDSVGQGRGVGVGQAYDSAGQGAGHGCAGEKGGLDI
jgi:serine/threonine-protein phosphatase 4 regulatory subunit 1